MSRRVLGAIAAGVGLALLALLAYSLDRSAWLFALYETGQERGNQLGLVAAIVVELAAVVLIASDGVAEALTDDPDLQRSLRLWSGRGLATVVGVQLLANLLAGYLRGGEQLLVQLGGGGRWSAAWWIAGASWLAINCAIPLCILILSKIEALLLRLLLRLPAPAAAAQRPATAPLRRFGWLRWPQSWQRSAPPAAPLPDTPAPAVAPTVVRVPAAQYDLYAQILALRDEDDALPTKWLAQRLDRSERTVQVRRGELVRLGVLVEASGRYARNGVALERE